MHISTPTNNRHGKCMMASNVRRKDGDYSVQQGLGFGDKALQAIFVAYVGISLRGG